MRRALFAVLLSTLVPVVGWAGTGSALAQVPGCVPTAGRTVGPQGFPGLRVKRVAPVYTHALGFTLSEGYSPAAAQREADALNSEGFVSGTRQYYFGRGRKARGDQGIAITVQLGSPEQAQAEFHRRLTRVKRLYQWKAFTVPTIPGARGLRQFPTTVYPEGASNLYFTDGSYFYILGTFVLRGGTGTDRITKAATGLYNRVHGAAACP